MKIDEDGFILLGEEVVGMVHPSGRLTEIWVTPNNEDVGFHGSLIDLLKTLTGEEKNGSN